MKLEAAILFVGYAVGSAYAAAAGDGCITTQGQGTFVSKGECRGMPYGNVHAQDAPDIQCCVEIPCQQAGMPGFCRSKSLHGCENGSFVPHFGKPWRCPGTNDIQCCVKNPAGGPDQPVESPMPLPTPQDPPQDVPHNGTEEETGNPTGERQDPTEGEDQGGFGEEEGEEEEDKGDGGKDGKDGKNNKDDKDDKDDKTKNKPKPKKKKKKDMGKKILAQAKKAKGKDYAWGGGSCKGPTGDQPPHDYGKVGFDCSGLVAWAVCKVTGRDLFSEGLRVTNSMYCASEKKLGYKKYDFKHRKAGDAIFFGGSCDCDNPSKIHHVALMMNSGDRMWNAPKPGGKVEEASVSGFGEEACPKVIRFNDKK